MRLRCVRVGRLSQKSGFVHPHDPVGLARELGAITSSRLAAPVARQEIVRLGESSDLGYKRPSAELGEGNDNLISFPDYNQGGFDYETEASSARKYRPHGGYDLAR